MKLPFKKLRGMEAAPQSAQHYADQLSVFMQGLSIEDKARVVAASKTAGHMELRLRFDEKGRQSMSVWLAKPGTDQAIKVIPADERAVIELPEAAHTRGGAPRKVGEGRSGHRAPSFLPTPAKNEVWPQGVKARSRNARLARGARHGGDMH